MNEPLYRIWDDVRSKYTTDRFVDCDGNIRSFNGVPQQSFYQKELSSYLQDSTGRMIFEGDRVGYADYGTAAIVFKDTAFWLKWDDERLGSPLLYTCIPKCLTVIGTIHDEETK